MDPHAFLKQIAATINADRPPVLALDTTFDSLEADWDSLTVVMTLETIEAEYGVALSGEDIRSCRTLGELFLKVQGLMA